MAVLPLQKGIVYGPVNSKRLGRSLGINLLSCEKKICSFDCIYCHYGRTDKKVLKPARNDLPSVERIVSAVEQVICSNQKFDYLTFSGNGEPMLHPDFAKIVFDIRRLKDRYYPQVPLALLSNSSRLVDFCGSTYDEEVDLATLSLIEFRIFKLDTADEELFQKINQPVAELKIGNIIDSLVCVSEQLPITIQAVFIDGPIKNYTDEALNDWIKAIIKIKPISIQICSTDRPVAKSEVKMLSNQKLEELAKHIQKKTKILTKAFFK
ncbi:MAG: radical SAM protein [candidate division WOR-3 bacterium]|nr:radical SAM protein [candidate division WOR-3 bacterium]